MAKCKYWKEINCNVKCPKNTDDYCNIIPSRKPDTIKVKAWARINEPKVVAVICGKISADSRRSESMNIPCTIVIKRRDWEKRK